MRQVINSRWMLKLLIRNPFRVVTGRDDGVGCEEGSAAVEDDIEDAATTAAVMAEVETATVPEGAWTGIATWTGWMVNRGFLVAGGQDAS